MSTNTQTQTIIDNQNTILQEMNKSRKFKFTLFNYIILFISITSFFGMTQTIPNFKEIHSNFGMQNSTLNNFIFSYYWVITGLQILISLTVTGTLFKYFKKSISTLKVYSFNYLMKVSVIHFTTVISLSIFISFGLQPPI